MTDENTTSPAGVGEREPMHESMTFDEAVASYLGDEDGDDGEAVEAVQTVDAEVTEPDAEGAAETEAAGQEQGEEVDPEQPEGEDGGESAEENEPIDFDVARGDMRFRLSDGTEFTAADVKRNWDDLRNVRQEKQEFAQERQAFSEHVQAIHQQDQQRAQEYAQFQQTAQLAEAVLRDMIGEPPVPPEPDPDDLYTTAVADAAYNRAIWEYNDRMGKLQQIQAQQQHFAHQQQQELQARQQQDSVAQQEYLKRNREDMERRLPFLKDPGKKAKFYSDLLTFGQKHDFTTEEMGNLYDARMFPVIHKAMEYDRITAKTPKPAPKQTQPGPKVAKPGQTANPADQKSAAKRQAFRRAQEKGSISEEEAIALL